VVLFRKVRKAEPPAYDSRVNWPDSRLEVVCDIFIERRDSVTRAHSQHISEDGLN